MVVSELRERRGERGVWVVGGVVELGVLGGVGELDE